MVLPFAGKDFADSTEMPGRGSCVARFAWLDSEVTLARLELLLVDLATRVALAQDLQCLVVSGRTSLAHEPPQAEDQSGDEESPEHEHHQHHHEAACSPHEHHRVHAPVPLPGSLLREGRCRREHGERDSADEPARMHRFLLRSWRLESHAPQTSAFMMTGACSNVLITLRSRIALDTKLSRVRCLTHVGREGSATGGGPGAGPSRPPTCFWTSPAGRWRRPARRSRRVF